MKLLFWGNQALEKNKTGVGWYNYNLLKQLDKKLNYYVSSHKKKLNISSEVFFSDRIINRNFSEKIFILLPIPYDIFFPKVEVYYFDGFFPLKCKGKKIAIIHDLMSLHYPENYGVLRRLSLKCYFKLASKKADVLIVVSENTKKDLINLYNVSADKIEVIYPGVDMEKFESEAIIKSEVLKKYNIHKKYFLYMGALRKNKNVDGIIKAYANYLSNGGENLLVIAGGKSGEYLMLKKLTEALGIGKKIVFTDYLPEEDKVGLYKGAEAFIMPSHYEGFGIPIIEAMAAGIPVITSKTSSLLEIAEGRALLVDPNDIKKIAEAMKKISEDIELRTELIRLGRERSKIFTWKKTCEKFLKVLDGVTD